MTEKKMSEENLQEERYCLAAARVKEIKLETAVVEPFRDFFASTAVFLEKILDLKEKIAQGKYKELSLEELRQKNGELYEDILPAHY